MELHLMRPEWMWSLLPAIILLALLWRQRGRSGSWDTVIAPELLQHLVSEKAGSRSINYLPLIFCAWALAALAASGPSWQKIPQPIHQKQDALVLLLDLSYSMKSADLPPSRLDRSRQKLLDMLQQRREGQTGLIAYAGDAHIVTPLTDDTPTIANLLPALHPDMMPMLGSDPASAVAQGVALLRSAGVSRGTLLLVTDGVAKQDRKAIEKILKGSGTRLNIMGIGTTTGAPIPLPQGGFMKDKAGAIVMPGLEEHSLRKLASATGGRYMRMQIDNSDLDYLLAENPLAEPEQTLVLDRTADTWDDAGYLLLLPLLPFALVLFRRGWLLLLLPVLFFAEAPSATAQTWEKLWLTPDQRGQRALQQGENEAAAKLFEDPGWAGAASYRSGDYESASEHFNREDSADSLYNRGNALARAGRIDEAIEAYQQSLELEPDQADAGENLALLEKLKEQQQNQEQQQQQDQQQEQQSENSQEQEQEQNQGEGQEQNQDQSQDGDPTQQDSSQGKQQQEPSADQQQTDSQQQSDEQESEQEAEQAAASAAASAAEREQEERDAAQAAQAQADPEEMERDQAMEQWLRRVPDDPSGLLREKFRYESRQRQEQGARSNDENYW